MTLAMAFVNVIAPTFMKLKIPFKFFFKATTTTLDYVITPSHLKDLMALEK
jgi:hypothetical protein